MNSKLAAQTADAPADPKKLNLQPSDDPPKTLRVLDTTAQPDTINDQGVTLSGARTHQMIVDGRPQSFRFKFGDGLEMPVATALKFLKHEGFLLVDENNQAREYRRRPKQPDELQAGETITLANDETIARLEELSTTALQQRVLEMQDSERFAERPDRQAMIRFMVEARIARAKVNAAPPDVAGDDFTPEPEEELAA